MVPVLHAAVETALDISAADEFDNVSASSLGTPYVGITGATTVEEINALLSAFDDQGIGVQSDHVPMLGILVSYKTLNGQFTANKRYPLIEDVPKLVHAMNGKAMAMIHYNSREMDTLADQVERLMDEIYTDGSCRALQLNIPWPSLQQTYTISNNHPDMSIVLQLSQKAMEGLTPQEIGKRAHNYAGLVNYVLIDPSGGKGEEFDMDHSTNIYWELQNQLPGARVGFAGGFDHKNTLVRIATMYHHLGNTDFCIDAEGGLRDKLSSEYGDDLLNIEKAEKYLCHASNAFRQY